MNGFLDASPLNNLFLGELMFLISLWRVCLRICTRISCNLLSTVARLGKRRANNFSQSRKWIVLLLEGRSASWKCGSFLLCRFHVGCSFAHLRTTFIVGAKNLFAQSFYSRMHQLFKYKSFGCNFSFRTCVNGLSCLEKLFQTWTW